jgi:TonB-dependent starch-binding outer membrane protein SusC
MSFKNLLKKSVLPLLLMTSQLLWAQDKTVTGKVTDSKDGSPVVGASVLVKGTSKGTTTKADGSFSISVSESAKTLTISSVGFANQDISIEGKSTVDVGLVATNSSLNEVVVTGYGTTRKKDLTGSVASIQAKDFNKGPITNPDQLLQGKVAGLQIINSSGQPGAATIVKIRGNNSIRSGNTPLYVIDGVPLDGRSPRPGVNVSGIGTSPDANPLIYINPADISSIDILKDASASAIYGSRGANGVVLITTRKGQVGPAKIDFGSSVGIGNIMRKIDVLNASGYKAALQQYGSKSDSGKSVDPFKEILRSGGAISQNYTVGLSGGTETGRYRASFLVADQQGIIRKSGLKKYVGNFNGQYKFLDKKLSFDFNVTAAAIAEKIVPISTDAGSAGNLISLALIWNPTLELKRQNGRYNQENKSGQVNPLALSDAYNDIANTTTLLGSFSAGYKITPDLEYKLLYGINYGTGTRKTELQGWIAATGGNADGAGTANVGSAQLSSQTITHTLNFNKKITQDISLNALAGFEYWKTSYEGNGQSIYKFNLNLDQLNVLPDYHYYNNLQAGDQGNLRTYAFKDPSVELQSYFARALINYEDKYLVTATFRADGSSKFGKNNRYAYFPSVAAAWNITNENFMKGGNIFNSLKLRVGYGQTGNQEFNPVDAALPVGVYNGYNSINAVHFANPDLKWETVESIDAGLDFTILHSRLWGFIDYFDKKTKNPILDFAISQPTAGTGTVYKNMDGVQAQKAWVTNKGFEISLGAAIIEKKDFTWNVTTNATFVKNKFVSPDLKTVPFVKNTGALHGQGSSGAYSEVIADGQPIDVFYLNEFLGFDKATGIAQYGTKKIFGGDPNPSVFLGFTTDVTYKKWSLGINMHGSFGNKIFNNTAMSVVNVNNIIGGRNIASGLVGNGESSANPIAPSTRFLEKGDFLKMGNATISYKVGGIGNVIKNANIYLSGSNLFVISKYKGFDPEVYVDKTLNGIPSLGVDYIGYPSVRTFIFGINFSL